jgi:hypothetical protein
MSKAKEYIDSVDGKAHASAVRIIEGLEAELAAAQSCFEQRLADYVNMLKEARDAAEGGAK